MNKVKLLKFLYWVFYLGLCFVSGWFSSEGLANYFSQRTSFFQSEEINKKWPVITINLDDPNSSVEYDKNTWIYYSLGYKGFEDIPLKLLKLQENIFQYKEINKTEKVFLEEYKHYDGKFRKHHDGKFRIIHLTELTEENPYGEIQIVTLKELHTKLLSIDFASLENSLGSIFSIWNDGQHLSYTIPKNHFKEIFIKPNKYVYLPQTSKCHDESYYDCIVSELDKMDFNHSMFHPLNGCSKKCIPNVFSYGKNFSTPFCQKNEEDFCARRVAINMIEATEKESKLKTYSRCKHSCEILQYSGVERTQYAIPLENHQLENNTLNNTEYGLFYDFAFGDNAPPHQMKKGNRMVVHVEYFIYNTMGMIGSVGGTFGLFIGFSVTGFISSAIEFLNKFKPGGRIYSSRNLKV